MKQKKAGILLLASALALAPLGATHATVTSARAPIEHFQFTEVLNLKGRAQIGRHKVTTWADTLPLDTSLRSAEKRPVTSTR